MSYLSEQMETFLTIDSGQMTVLESFFTFLSNMDPETNPIPYGLLIQIPSQEEGLAFLRQLEDCLNILLPEKHYELVHATEKVFLGYHLSSIIKSPRQIFVLSDLFPAGNADHIYTEFKNSAQTVKIVLASTETIDVRIKNNHDLYHRFLPKHICLSPVSAEEVFTTFLTNFQEEYRTTKAFEEKLHSYIHSFSDTVSYQGKRFMSGLYLQILRRMNETCGIQVYKDGREVDADLLPLPEVRPALSETDAVTIMDEETPAITEESEPVPSEEDAIPDWEKILLPEHPAVPDTDMEKLDKLLKMVLQVYTRMEEKEDKILWKRLLQEVVLTYGKENVPTKQELNTGVRSYSPLNLLSQTNLIMKEENPVDSGNPYVRTCITDTSNERE